MIEQAKILNPAMNFSVAKCETVPFADNTFNVIIVCAAYHHFPDVQQLCKRGIPVIRGICNPFIRFSKSGDVRFYSPQEIIQTMQNEDFKNGKYIKDGHVQIVSFIKE